MKNILLVFVSTCIFFMVHDFSFAQSLSFGRRAELPFQKKIIIQSFLPNVDPQEIINKKVKPFIAFDGQQTQKKIRYNYYYRFNKSWTYQENEIQKRKDALLNRKIYEVEMVAKKYTKNFFSEAHSIVCFNYYLFTLNKGETIPGFPLCKDFELAFVNDQGYKPEIIIGKKYIFLFDETGFLIDFKDEFFKKENKEIEDNRETEESIFPLLLEKIIESDGSVKMRVLTFMS